MSLDPPGAGAGREDTVDAHLEALMDSFAGSLRRGEQPSVDEYVARHPELAGKIRELFPALRFLEKANAPASEEVPTASGPSPVSSAGGTPAPRRLGDYSIVREIGRGGMGIVYEAIEETLGRRVALKILPFHALLDPRRLERFEREARSAASLDHAHIVHVHGVGEADGIRYYAMQFIPGQGLDLVIDEVRRARSGELRNPSSALPASHDSGQFFEGVARIGAQVAQALAYAHAQGVLHRDIKPSNLLLDREGKAWITDFGLAKAMGSDDLTRSGEVVGTLKYLAPERLKGWSDPRSDVYSLGVTLYELATLHCPFDDDDRSRLIRRIAEDEPPRPRKLDPKIPRDFETVILKAIAKEPSQRYSSAAELAQDLERFLRHEPVRARASGVWYHSVKWARRRPALAALVLVCILGGAAVVAGSLWYNTLLRAETARAKASFQQSVEAVNRMLTWVGDQGLATVPQAEPVRRGLLEEALKFHEDFLRAEPRDPSLRVQAARAYLRVGQIYQLIGQRVDADKAYARSLQILELLSQERPGDPACRETLVTARAQARLFANEALPSEGAAVVSRFPAPRGTVGVVDVAAADMEDDGKLDLVLASRWSSHVSVLQGTASRAFEACDAVEVGLSPYQIAVADMDGDRHPDCVTIDRDSRSVTLLSGKPGGRFTKQVFELELEPWSLVVDDLDGDGRLEAVTLGKGLRILSRGTGSDIALEPRIDCEGFGNWLLSGDFDGDSRVDLLAGSISKQMTGLIEAWWGTGMLPLPAAEPLSLCLLPIGLLKADMDGDANLDVVALDRISDSWLVLRNGGARRFVEGQKIAGPKAPFPVGSADFDGDGDIDLALSCEGDGIVTMLLNAGDGTFPESARFASGGRSFRGLARDLDGDGQADIAVANGNANDVAVMFEVRALIARQRDAAVQMEHAQPDGDAPR